MTSKPEILLTTSWYKPAMDELDQHFVAHRLYEAEDRSKYLAAIGSRCVGAAGVGRFDAALMDALPQVRVFANCGVGYDGVDVPAATARGIRVSNTPDVLSDEVADFTLGLLLATLRRIPEGDRYVRDGLWETKGPMAFGRRVWGLKVGILGLGRIGLEIARRCEAFKLEVSYHSRQRKDAPYPYHDSLLGMANDVDILIAIVPGSDSTHHIVDRAVLDALGPEGILINVARGSVVDESELILALQEGRLGGAGLDVFADEPRVPDALKALTNKVVLQPHQASATHDTRLAMGRLVMENLLAGVAGKPLLTPVN